MYSKVILMSAYSGLTRTVLNLKKHASVAIALVPKKIGVKQICAANYETFFYADEELGYKIC